MNQFSNTGGYIINQDAPKEPKPDPVVEKVLEVPSSEVAQDAKETKASNGGKA